MNGSDVKVAARRVNDNPALGFLARLGYVASGVLHIVLGLIAVQIAWFHSATSADQSGAFGALGHQPLGKVALWVVAIGFAGLTVWQVTEALGTSAGAGARLKAASKAVVYAVLAWTAFRFAIGSSSSSNQQTQDVTANLMSKPGGRFAVAAVGVVILVVAIYHVYKGWARKFLRDLKENPGRFVTAAGRLGYVAKGVALAVVGFLFIAAATKAKPGEAGGLDKALRTLRDQPLGGVLLTVVAAGFLAYGVYSFARARYART
jgi:hypothetical protein